MKIEISELNMLFRMMEKRNLSIIDIINMIRIIGKPEFNLEINFSRTLQEMINAGNYDLVNSNITEKYFFLEETEHNKQMTVLSKLFFFTHDITSQKIIDEMSEFGFFPANSAELLALGELYPKLQDELHIVALGSPRRVNGVEGGVLVLRSSNGQRVLGLEWLNDMWINSKYNYCFLGVQREILKS